MLPLQLRIDADSLPALIVGALLLVAASAMGIWQWLAHRRLVQNSDVSESVYQFTERQIRNRLIVGGLLFLLGVAIPLGDQLDFRGRAALFFSYWMGVLLLVFAMVVVVIIDALATLAFARITQIELRHERRELEEEIRRYRASKNGANSPTDESP